MLPDAVPAARVGRVVKMRMPIGEFFWSHGKPCSCRPGASAPSSEHYFFRRRPGLRCLEADCPDADQNQRNWLCQQRTQLVGKRIGVVDDGVSRMSNDGP